MGGSLGPISGMREICEKYDAMRWFLCPWPDGVSSTVPRSIHALVVFDHHLSGG